jgi:hypothetical protein
LALQSGLAAHFVKVLVILKADAGSVALRLGQKKDQAFAKPEVETSKIPRFEDR